MGASIAKLGERGALVEGYMIRLAALDLVLRIVRARMVRIAFDLEVASMDAGDRAAGAPCLGIPAHSITDLECLRQGCPIRRPKNCNAGSSRTEYSSGIGIPTAARPIGSSKSQHFAAFDFAIARLESTAMPASHAPSPGGAMTRTRFSP